MGAWSVTVPVAMADPVTAMVIAAAAGVGNHRRPPGRATSGGARDRGRRRVVEEELHALRLQLLREVHALALHLGGLLQLRGLHALIRLAEAPYRMRQLPEPARAVVAAATVGARFVRPLPLPVHRRRKRQQRREAVGGLRGHRRLRRRRPPLGRGHQRRAAALREAHPQRRGHLAAVVRVVPSAAAAARAGLVAVCGREEKIETVEELPGGDRLGPLDLVLLERVDAVLALDIGPGPLGVAVTGGDGVGDLLPLRVPEAAAAQRDEPLTPGVDERGGGAVAPGVLPPAAPAAGGGGAGVQGRRGPMDRERDHHGGARRRSGDGDGAVHGERRGGRRRGGGGRHVVVVVHLGPGGSKRIGRGERW
jgi:hypothetical protein